MITKSEFLRKYSKELLDGNGAVFVGAGMSITAGYVNWKDLLRQIAEDLELDIDTEHDLIALAQYEVNRLKTRDSVDETIIRQFCKKARETPSHQLLARLPIDSVWTTNYDKVLEEAYTKAGRTIDVKITTDQLRNRKPHADVSIFKMHGDVDSPSDAVLTKNDYECYESEKSAFTVQLLADLLTKRFLFLGFSFTDPNIEYTFNRLRRLLNPAKAKGDKMRDHYCILKRPTREDYDKTKHSDSQIVKLLKVDTKRFEHRVIDLQNYGIQTVAIDSYEEVEEILRSLTQIVLTRTVMISGAAETFIPMGEPKLNQLCRLLGQRLIEEDFDIVSGVGKGVSGDLMIGVHEALMRPKQGRFGQRLRLFPFPYWMPNTPSRNDYYEANRDEMAAQGGVTIVICGNKADPSTGNIIDSPGVMTEVAKARSNGQFIIPVGATGHAANTLWNEAMSNLATHFRGLDVINEMEILGDTSKSPEDIVASIIAIITKIRSKTN